MLLFYILSVLLSNDTWVSSDPDIKSEPLEFQAIVLTQPWCPYKRTKKYIMVSSISSYSTDLH